MNIVTVGLKGGVVLLALRHVSEEEAFLAVEDYYSFLQHYLFVSWCAVAEW